MDYDVVVVGAGLGGLTAALYAARSGLRTLVVEQLMAGGQVANIEHVEDFPGQPEPVGGMVLGPTVQLQAEAAGATVVTDTVTGLEPQDGGYLVRTAEGGHTARTVIVATGSSLRTLGVPGEEEHRGRGVSQCADCDGYFFSGRRVLVVGGGDAALQEVSVLAGMGVESIVLAHRGTAFDSAQQVYADRVQSLENVEVLTETEVVEIHDEDGAVGSVSLRQGDRVWEEKVGGVFVFTGLVPNTAWLAGQLDLDETGHVVVDALMATSLPGVFAVGDVRADSVAQLAASAGDGATAAIAATRYVRAL